MTKKTHLIIAIVFITLSISIIFAGAITNAIKNKDPKVLPTVKDQCFLSGSIDACIQLDKSNKEAYKKLTEVLSGIANDNAKVKEYTQKLLS